MAVNRNSVTFMTGYLKHAVTFEKNFYVWSRAMKEVNNRMQTIYDERSRLQAAQSSANKALAVLNSPPDKPMKTNQEEIAEYNKQASKALTVVVCAMLLLFGLGCLLGLLILNQETSLAIPREWVVPVLGLATMIIGSLFPGFVPVFIGKYFRAKADAKNPQAETRANAAAARAETRRQLLQSQADDAENDLIVNTLEEAMLNKDQDEIFKQLQIARNNLAQVYAMNVLPPKYQNLNAVATLYEYLETGRCNTIQGHGGIYDTYETERVHLAQLAQLIQANATLSRIEDSQRQICRELQQANSTLSGIRAHLNEIERTNAEIAHNTAISAAANQQTAAATQWLAWSAWANGY